MINLECGVCGVPHSLTQTLHNKYKRDGGTWHCPNGHEIGFHEVEVDRLKQEVEDLKAKGKRLENSNEMWKNEYEIQRKSAISYKGHYTRLKNKQNG